LCVYVHCYLYVVLIVVLMCPPVVVVVVVVGVAVVVFTMHGVVGMVVVDVVGVGHVT